jgi:outer membrane protein
MRLARAAGRRRALFPAMAILALGAVAAGAQSSAAGAVSLTVDQAVSRALSNQPVIQQALASAEAARSRVGEAQSAYWPSVVATGSYTRIAPDQSISVTIPGLGSFALTVPVDNWDAHVGVNQVITQFGRRDVQVKLAESGLSAARIGVDQVKTAISYQAAQVFYTALFLQEQGKALDEQYGNLEQHLQVIKVREDTGSATRLEELSTQVRMATLQSQRTDVQSQLQKLKIALFQLTGLDQSTDLSLSGGFAQGPAPAAASTLVDAALQKRPDVRQAVEAERMADLNQRFTVDSLFPTLSARGTVGYRNGLQPDVTAMTFNWTAGLSLNVPLFQGFLGAHGLDEANRKLDAAKQNTLAVKASATTQVLQAAQDVLGTRQQVAISAGALEQATQMVEVAKVQYDIGVITNLEYLDSQTALETSSLTNLAARYREVLAEYALRQATGETLGN